MCYRVWQWCMMERKVHKDGPLWLFFSFFWFYWHAATDTTQNSTKRWSNRWLEYHTYKLAILTHESARARFQACSACKVCTGLHWKMILCSNFEWQACSFQVELVPVATLRHTRWWQMRSCDTHCHLTLSDGSANDSHWIVTSRCISGHQKFCALVHAVKWRVITKSIVSHTKRLAMLESLAQVNTKLELKPHWRTNWWTVKLSVQQSGLGGQSMRLMQLCKIAEKKWGTRISDPRSKLIARHAWKKKRDILQKYSRTACKIFHDCLQKMRDWKKKRKFPEKKGRWMAQ